MSDQVTRDDFLRAWKAAQAGGDELRAELGALVSRKLGDQAEAGWNRSKMPRPSEVHDGAVMIARHYHQVGQSHLFKSNCGVWETFDDRRMTHLVLNSRDPVEWRIGKLEEAEKGGDDEG